MKNKGLRKLEFWYESPLKNVEIFSKNHLIFWYELFIYVCRDNYR